MDAYNIADLERKLVADHWTVDAHDWVATNSAPGQVQKGGYTVTLTSPQNGTFTGNGPTRTDALRSAAESAGIIEPDMPHLQ
jgi:hypothetical protein